MALENGNMSTICFMRQPGRRHASWHGNTPGSARNTAGASCRLSKHSRFVMKTSNRPARGSLLSSTAIFTRTCIRPRPDTRSSVQKAAGPSAAVGGELAKPQAHPRSERRFFARATSIFQADRWSGNRSIWSQSSRTRALMKGSLSPVQRHYVQV